MTRRGEYFNWYVNGLLDDAIRDLASSLRGNIAVDIGCGDQPYRRHLAGVARYVGVDMPGMPDSGRAADIHGDAQHLPLASGIADVVLCTEVMEHVPRPQQMLADIHRVLAPGGALVLSVPFSWHIHDEPHDYWRFTHYGLRLLLEDAGFVVEDLREVNGMVGASLAGQCYILLFSLGRYRALAAPLIWLTQMLARGLRHFDRNTRTTSNYVLLARKPR